MPSIRVLFILIFISSIPAIAAFVWFRLARYPISLASFSLALLTGVASFFPALFLQKLFATGAGLFRITGKWSLIAQIFVRIALTEELSRLIMLLLLFFIIRPIIGSLRQPGRPVDYSPEPPGDSPVLAITKASTAGLVAGFGFAIIESAVYGASDPGNALLRIFTAAPLHGACGFRVGAAAASLRNNPGQALLRFASAVIIHGVYNFMLFIPGLVPSIVAILIALCALASSVMAIRNGMAESQEFSDKA